MASSTISDLWYALRQMRLAPVLTITIVLTLGRESARLLLPALAASALPARRAASVVPLEALRTE